jgi:thiol:disulfide interchange protein DsbC
MSNFLRLSVVLLIGFGVGLVQAAANQDAEITAQVRAKILQSVGLREGLVSNSPVPGFYQVEAPRNPLLYVSHDSKFVFAGTLYGITASGPVNLHEKAMQPRRKALLDAVATENQIIFPAKGDKKAHVYVFTDIDCGYCRKLHNEIADINELGIEVRYLAFPRVLGNPQNLSIAKSGAMLSAQVGGDKSETYKRMVQAWCADDSQKTLTELKRGGSIRAPTCTDHPVIEQYELGGSIGVTGTPAIVFADGTFQPGYIPAKALGQALGLY